MTRGNWTAVALLCFVATATVFVSSGPEIYGLPHVAGPIVSLLILPATIVLHVLDPLGRIQALAAGRPSAEDRRVWDREVPPAQRADGLMDP